MSSTGAACAAPRVSLLIAHTGNWTGMNSLGLIGSRTKRLASMITPAVALVVTVGLSVVPTLRTRDRVSFVPRMHRMPQPLQNTCLRHLPPDLQARFDSSNVPPHEYTKATCARPSSRMIAPSPSSR